MRLAKKCNSKPLMSPFKGWTFWLKTSKTRVPLGTLRTGIWTVKFALSVDYTTMVVSNSLMTQKSPRLLRSLLFRFSSFSRTPSCHFNCQNRINPIYITRRFTICHRSFSLPSTHGFKVSGGSELGLRYSGHRSFRVSSGGGSGGGSGSFGGPGGGNSGGRGGDGDGSGWPLLSW